MLTPAHDDFSDLAPKGKLMVIVGSLLATSGVFGPLTLLVAGVVPATVPWLIGCSLVGYGSWRLAERRLLVPAQGQRLKFHPRLSPLAPDWAHKLLRDLDRWDGTMSAEPLGRAAEVDGPRPFDWDRD